MEAEAKAEKRSDKEVLDEINALKTREITLKTTIRKQEEIIENIGKLKVGSTYDGQPVDDKKKADLLQYNRLQLEDFVKEQEELKKKLEQLDEERSQILRNSPLGIGTMSAKLDELDKPEIGQPIIESTNEDKEIAEEKEEEEEVITRQTSRMIQGTREEVEAKKTEEEEEEMFKEAKETKKSKGAKESKLLKEIEGSESPKEQRTKEGEQLRTELKAGKEVEEKKGIGFQIDYSESISDGDEGTEYETEAYYDILW
jgi:hypothetical protein